jgi:hypothetical protein
LFPALFLPSQKRDLLVEQNQFLEFAERVRACAAFALLPRAGIQPEN